MEKLYICIKVARRDNNFFVLQIKNPNDEGGGWFYFKTNQQHVDKHRPSLKNFIINHPPVTTRNLYFRLNLEDSAFYYDFEKKEFKFNGIYLDGDKKLINKIIDRQAKKQIAVLKRKNKAFIKKTKRQQDKDQIPKAIADLQKEITDKIKEAVDKAKEEIDKQMG